ncbi:unnamed protein product [Peronospora belbahrii]|uniref:Crinkler effector protein N-terminal domain-containing protein n=1 Tax=Peronospora belbahrii TaxID=622444 RepID=A0AAU9LFK4_9STRA|nr:unnamed protein product [Peronospora belbahrii]
MAKSAFLVRVYEANTVYDSKVAIEAEKPDELKDVDAFKLQLFLAKKDASVWLSSRSEGATRPAMQIPKMTEVVVPEKYAEECRLLDEWDINAGVVVGSPGIGKSTMLCIMAFYLVFRHNKNVLVYRRMVQLREEYYLIYLGHENKKVVQYTVARCTTPNATDIYEELIRQKGVSNV